MIYSTGCNDGVAVQNQLPTLAIPKLNHARYLVLYSPDIQEPLGSNPQFPPHEHFLCWASTKVKPGL
jgi:hypothetical protein